MVNNRRKIIKYKRGKEAYHKKNIKAKQNNEKSKRDYYVKSMSALVSYLKNNEKNTNENTWNHYAVKNGYL